MKVESETSSSQPVRIRYLVTDLEERARHSVKRQPRYVCKCGEEFDRYADWEKHRTKAAARIVEE